MTDEKINCNRCGYSDYADSESWVVNNRGYDWDGVYCEHCA